MNKEMTICDTCTGCGACSVICPKEAISIRKNFEGFYQYSIDHAKCIQCGLCKKVCPENDIVVEAEEKTFEQKYYAGRNDDMACILKSSSGGIFSAFATTIINKGGSVYGVAINYPSCEIVYKRATNIEDTYPMRGSKYVQAKLSKDILINVIQDAEADKPILFTGTSCYINGVKSLLEKRKIDMNNIYFMDFVCAGVISTKIWDKEIEHFSNRYGSINEFSFRHKKYGWRDFSIFIQTKTIDKYTRFTVSNIGQFQSKKEAVGISCNECKYRSYDKPGDITVGDFWNEQYLPHEWWDDKGTSSILVNTSKGEALLQDSNKYIKLYNVEKRMVYSSRFEKNKGEIDHSRRTELYRDAENIVWGDFIKKWIHIGIKDRLLLTIIRPIVIKMGILRLKK
ncbi:MAG: Coenzyme F420 hydrogenase/dehydrogenase, beta subunit C-terminal domain [Butyrivibrio sp.]|nr:Coenzyme F420 hydrogenase/dehydrogenase, beta subunit C-terminal domain [Butyrivibrio sp.]